LAKLGTKSIADHSDLSFKPFTWLRGALSYSYVAGIAILQRSYVFYVGF